MPLQEEYNSYGEDLEKILILRTSPVAVKMLEKKEDIPDEAYRPKRDSGTHLAQCQAFALSRRDKKTVAMLKEDHWCPAALMAYGMVESPDFRRGHPYDAFEYGKYIGILTAPLKTAMFEPDVVIVYSNTSQLRGMILNIKVDDMSQVNSHFFPPSCAYAVVYPMRTSQYWVVLPDPGEYQRALGGEDEMMFAIPRDKLEGFMTSLRQSEDKAFGYRGHNMLMLADFPHPEFYKNMFRSWGLEVKD